MNMQRDPHAHSSRSLTDNVTKSIFHSDENISSEHYAGLSHMSNTKRKLYAIEEQEESDVVHIKKEFVTADAAYDADIDDNVPADVMMKNCNQIMEKTDSGDGFKNVDSIQSEKDHIYEVS